MDNYKETLKSESDININQQNDEDNNTSKPNGGFPPIFICNSRDIKKSENTGNREYATPKSAISIKDIMNRRRMNIQSRQY